MTAPIIYSMKDARGTSAEWPIFARFMAIPLRQSSEETLRHRAVPLSGYPPDLQRMAVAELDRRAGLDTETQP